MDCRHSRFAACAAAETNNQSESGIVVRCLLALLRFYKKFVSPFLPPSCRFTPTCSEYAMEAVQRYGIFRGLMLSFLRLLRCHPFAKGGYDPVK